jgi:hypothetical protein
MADESEAGGLPIEGGQETLVCTKCGEFYKADDETEFCSKCGGRLQPTEAMPRRRVLVVEGHVERILISSSWTYRCRR